MNQTKLAQESGLYRVVIVEDDPGVAQVLAAMLRTPQRSVETYDTPDAAVELLRDGPVDMAFISQKLPNRQGLALGERIKERCQGACVVYYSGDLAEQSMVRTAIATVQSAPQPTSPFGEVLHLAHHNVEH